MEIDNEEEEEPSIEDIKQVVNSKRNNTSKKYSKEDRLKNLELAREKRKNMNLMKKVPAPIPASIPAPIPAPIVAPIPAPLTENDLINELKNMFLRQNEILEKIKIEPKTRVKKEPKKKQTIRSLDLTLTDKEINNIITTNINNDKKIIEDPKLKMFLDAFNRL